MRHLTDIEKKIVGNYHEPSDLVRRYRKLLKGLAPWRFVNGKDHAGNDVIMVLDTDKDNYIGMIFSGWGHDDILRTIARLQKWKDTGEWSDVQIYENSRR